MNGPRANRLGPALAGLSGFVALSYEILWYRTLDFLHGGWAPTFGLLLGSYLLGIALGALNARSYLREARARENLAPIAAFLLLSNLAGYAVVPGISFAATIGPKWTAFPIVAAAATFLGASLPLIAHLSVAPDRRAGEGISYLLAANIAGSTLGTLGTGFVLLEVLSTAAICVSLLVLGVCVAVLALFAAGLPRGRLAVRASAAALSGALAAAAAPWLFDGLYERLQWKQLYRPDRRFVTVVENRSGIVTVTPDGGVYGGGELDGMFNTDLAHDVNAIHRAYALSAFHPDPKEILFIGLGSGSWAWVAANHPQVESVTVVEINPGYLEAIRSQPLVAGLLDAPHVSIEIADGRRWLAQRPDRRFDVIVANTRIHWRSNSTNVLSVEFLELVRRRLNPGGVYYFNPSGSGRSERTAAVVFPHALVVSGFVAVSDEEILFDEARWRETLLAYRLGGRPVLGPEPGAYVAGLVAKVRGGLRDRGRILAETEGLDPITDDNMGTEWEWR